MLISRKQFLKMNCSAVSNRSMLDTFTHLRINPLTQVFLRQRILNLKAREFFFAKGNMNLQTVWGLGFGKLID